MPPDFDPLQGFESAPDATKMAMIALAVRSIARSMRDLADHQAATVEDLTNQVKWMQRSIIGALITIVGGLILALLERGPA